MSLSNAKSFGLLQDKLGLGVDSALSIIASSVPCLKRPLDMLLRRLGFFKGDDVPKPMEEINLDTIQTDS